VESVFPEAKKFKYPLDDDLVPYYLAMLAIEKKSFTHDHFAMEILYNLFSDPIKASKLEKQYGLNSQEFIKLAGEVDIFRVTEIEKIKGENERTEAIKKIENILRYSYRKILRK
jgi:hypothetical protein